jgi:hypothetical protein
LGRERPKEQRDWVRQICFSSDSHAKRIAQLLAEADKRGKTEMVDKAMQCVKSREPSKQG